MKWPEQIETELEGRWGYTYAAMECVICMRTTDEIYKVTCGSSVPHLMCFECEGEWRSKMPKVGGMRTMTCPTCRQPERERTVESLTRELIRMDQYMTRELILLGQRQTILLYNLNRISEPRTVSSVVRARAPTTRPRVVPCASGRECRSRSVSARTKTHLQCTRCNVVACCRNCKSCLEC